MHQLILIGYWPNESEPQFPDPHLLVDNEWDEEERRTVIAHLKAGIQMPYACGGKSWCRICGQRGLGSLEYTDGVYLWPEGLPHYLEQHNVKLPEVVSRHMLNNGNKDLEEDLKIFPNGFSTDYEWWTTIGK